VQTCQPNVHVSSFSAKPTCQNKGDKMDSTESFKQIYLNAPEENILISVGCEHMFRSKSIHCLEGPIQSPRRLTPGYSPVLRQTHIRPSEPYSHIRQQSVTATIMFQCTMSRRNRVYGAVVSQKSSAVVADDGSDVSSLRPFCY
jgi:hypothetical protein